MSDTKSSSPPAVGTTTPSESSVNDSENTAKSRESVLGKQWERCTPLSGEVPFLSKEKDLEEVRHCSASFSGLEYFRLENAIYPKIETLTEGTKLDAMLQTPPKHSRKDIPILPHRWKLIEAHLQHLDIGDLCTIRADQNAFEIIIEGEEEAVLNAQLTVHEIMSSIDDEFLPDVSPEMAQRLLTSEGQAILDKCNISGTLSVQDDVLVLTANRNTVAETAKKLKELIQCREVPVLEPCRPFLHSQEWQALVERLQKKFVVIIELNVHNNIVISGVEVEGALEELQMELERNAVTKETVQCAPGIGRFIETHELEYWRSLKSRSVNKVSTQGETDWLIELSGQDEAVSAAKKELQRIIHGIKCERKEINKPGIRALFESTLGKSLLKGVEATKCCLIEVLPGTRDPGRSQTIRVDKDKDSTTDFVTPAADTGCSQGEKSSVSTAGLEVKEGERLLFHQNGVYLVLARGDITQYKADVLVNTPVADSKQFSKAGAVAKAFGAAGGEELEKEYVAVRAASDDIVTKTSAYGKLQCQRVYHFELNSWKENRVQDLKAKLSDCLTQCVSADKLSSIAFPTVGCGQLHYPVDRVADCFREEIVQLADEGRTVKLQVIVVAFDEITHGKMAAAYDTEVKPKVLKGPKSYEISSPRTSTSASPSPALYSANASVVFQVSGRSSQAVADTLQEIDNQLTSLMCELEIMEVPELDHISDIQLKSLEDLNSQSVAVTVDQMSGHIQLAGITKEVNACRKKIDVIVKKIDGSSLTGAERLWYLSEKPVSVPEYWTKNEKAGKKHHGKARYSQGNLTKVDAKVVKTVTDLVEKCWRADLVGLGADARNLGHKNIEVKKVERVENRTLWFDYDINKKKLMGTAASNPITPIAGREGESEILTYTCNLQDLDELIEKEISEVFLFHGTRPDNWPAIINQGFDFRLSKRAYFGKGVYFAESSTKADQYADYAKERQDGDHFMFVSRVLLGNAYICNEHTTFERPPCTEPSCQKADCKIHSHFFDSVVGTHRKAGDRLLFREFIVYEKALCYPEFLVTYVRK